MAERATLNVGGPNQFKAQALVKSERFLDLDRRQQYFDCTQHDWKRYDFNGRPVRPGPISVQPLITTEVAPFYVSLYQRRPSSPVRMGKIIVDAFTNMLFGEDRWPRFLCQGDEDTQDYAEALAKEENLRIKMIEVRNLGGAVGSVGMSWCFKDGKPRVDVHNTKNLYVHEWKDRAALVPAHVSEVYLYPVDEYDAAKGKVVRKQYWYRHDWDEEDEIGFQPVEYKINEEPDWKEDPEASANHDFGFCPFIWIQNTPHKDPDGVPDYNGQYESMDTLDVIASVLARGTTLNLDPTLILNMDPNITAKTGVKKGSDQAIVVGEGGDAKYLELAGTGVTAGISVFQLKRRTILEATQCVVPDPEEVAASGTSSVAIKAIYQPMLGMSAVHREQYGAGMKRLLEQQLEVARDRHGTSVSITSPADPENGKSEETTEDAIQMIDLPPKVKDTPKTDDDGNPETNDKGIPTGAVDTEEQDRVPGEGEILELGWGEWFPMTPQDRQLAVQALQLAAGAGKAVLSQQTAVEEAAVIFNRNPNEEWSRIQTAQKADDDKQAEMLKSAGGPMAPGVGGGMKLDPKTGKMVPAGSPKPPGGGKGGIPGKPPSLGKGDDAQGAAAVDGNPFAKKKPGK